VDWHPHFSLESVHNDGIDLGTSGRIDSNVADAASAVSFLVKPTVAQTAGDDRSIIRGTRLVWQ